MSERHRVLIVDDNPANVKLLRFVVAARGYEVRTAGDAGSARRVLSEFDPALILMDLQMPGTDGLTFTRELRADPRFAETVIVAVTAYAMKGDQERALEAGCDGYITKPVDTRGLGDELATYLESGSRPR